VFVVEDGHRIIHVAKFWRREATALEIVERCGIVGRMEGDGGPKGQECADGVHGDGGPVAAPPVYAQLEGGYEDGDGQPHDREVLKEFLVERRQGDGLPAIVEHEVAEVDIQTALHKWLSDDGGQVGDGLEAGVDSVEIGWEEPVHREHLSEDTRVVLHRGGGGLDLHVVLAILTGFRAGGQT
jgi:hypothetical protein